MSKLTTEKKRKVPKGPESLPGVMDTLQRAHLLVQGFLKSMEKSMQDAEYGEEWGRMFGSKDSAVSNLQKLVTVVGQLHAQVGSMQPVEHLSASSAPTLEWTAEDMAMLAEWIRVGEASESG